jgi:hypothetical protein
VKHWGVLPSMPLKWTSRGRKTLSLCGMNRGHHFRVWESASISTTGVVLVLVLLSFTRVVSHLSIEKGDTTLPAEQRGGQASNWKGKARGGNSGKSGILYIHSDENFQLDPVGLTGNSHQSR